MPNLSKQQDLRVDFIVNEAQIPSVPRVFDLAVVALSADGTDNTNAPVLITALTDLQPLVTESEYTELSGGFTGKAFWLYTVGTSVPQNIGDLIITNALTAIFTSATTALAKDINFSFDGIKVFTCTDESPWSNTANVNLASQNNVCIMADPELNGKALFSFSSFLVDYPVPTMQTTINNESFTSAFINKGQRDALIESNISFWMQASDATFLWDLYIGGDQAQGKYSYFTVKEEVGETVSSFIARGALYSNATLTSLQSGVSTTLSSLKTRGVIAGYNVTFTKVEDQMASDKVKGIVKGFTVDFNEQYRIAEVSILIQGEI